MSDITEANTGITFKSKPLLRLLCFYLIFAVIAAASLIRDLNPRPNDIFASFNTYFIIIWVIGIIFCVNGSVRGISRYSKKLNAIDADESGLTIRSYPDYPPVTVRWSNIKRAIRIDDCAYIEIRDESDVFGGMNPFSSAIVRYGGFFTGSRLVRSDYTGVKNGPCAVAVKTSLLEATADEVAAFVNKNLAKYKI